MLGQHEKTWTDAAAAAAAIFAANVAEDQNIARKQLLGLGRIEPVACLVAATSINTLCSIGHLH